MKDLYNNEITVGSVVVYAENHMYATVELGTVEQLTDDKIAVRSKSTNRVNKRQPRQVIVMPQDFRV